MRGTLIWSERKSTLEQERKFKRLITLHTLTDAWIQTLTPKAPASHRIERMARVTLNPNLWQFEKARLDHLPLHLEELVGAQEIDTFLNELKETIWIIQASTLESAETGASDSAELKNVLEQASWGHGKLHAESIWGPRGNFSLEEGFQAFMETHVYGTGIFLPERISSREITLIWRHSPLHDPALKNSSSVHLLCALHQHWIKGFLYGVSRDTKVESGITDLNGERYPHFTLR